MLKIYNTLTRKKEEFKPQGSTVKMYACGVTVYDFCHVGHGRSLYIFEVIRRYLKFKGFSVKFVRNITDIDDKIIDKAKKLTQEGFSLEEAFWKVREKYIKSYYEDLENLRIPPADFEPRPTQCIPQIIEFISKIIEKGFAYIKEGNVYFRVRKFSSYGKLSRRNIDELFKGVRIEPDPLKEDPLDFALWKAKKEGEPSWRSPFGEGRPGWHIECSVMAKEFLGIPLDIHGGGKDLIFPHHENEIAQSESIYPAPFSFFWMHHGLITIKGEKMAKSLGNFYTLKDILKKYTPEDLKLFYLSAHYRSPQEFSLKHLEQASSEKKRLHALEDELQLLEERPLKDKVILNLRKEFEEAMDDDFNLPRAKGVLFKLISLANQTQDKDLLGEIKKLLYMIGDIFILFKEKKELPSDFKEYVEKRLKERERLRKEKRYDEADKIRKELEEKGIIVEDLKNGKSRWRIKR